MTEKENEGLEPEELEEQNGEELPDREAMSVIKVPGAEPMDPGYTLPIEPPSVPE
jgi:hypothetical protein